MKRLALAVIVLAVAGALRAEAQGVRPPILGAWMYQDKEMTVRAEFTADGRFKRSTKTAQGTETAKGKYKVVGKAIELRPDDSDEVIHMTFRITEEDKLEITSEDGEVAVLARQAAEKKGEEAKTDEEAAPEEKPAKKPKAESKAPSPKERQGQLRLMKAARDGDVDGIKELLDQGVEVDCRYDNGMTPLLMAAMNGHAEAIAALLAAGADVNAKDEDGMTATMYAAQQQHVPAVKALLKAKPDLTVGNKSVGMTALMFAAGTGNLDNLKALIAAGADINAKSKKGATAAVYAEAMEKPEAAALLKKAAAKAAEKE